MTNFNNTEKKDKRTEKLTSEEHESLKAIAAQQKSMTDFAITMKLERVVVINAITRGSAAPATIKKIRKYLQLQTA